LPHVALSVALQNVVAHQTSKPRDADRR
jgi:hypothetical protein